MGHISAMALFTSESWTFSEAACTFNHLKCIECLDQFLKKKKKKVDQCLHPGSFNYHSCGLTNLLS